MLHDQHANLNSLDYFYICLKLIIWLESFNYLGVKLIAGKCIQTNEQAIKWIFFVAVANDSLKNV